MKPFHIFLVIAGVMICILLGVIEANNGSGDYATCYDVRHGPEQC